jgi:VIT1/CCC1 family predicted Fe2+/Mn2+ transporter
VQAALALEVVMPVTRHMETHFTATETVRDIVIGMADGLTVPFALAAGLAGTIAQPNVIVIAGLAEIAAGAIAMGLGGYLAARTDSEHYTAERERELRETEETPGEERAEVARVLREYGLTDAEARPVVRAITANRSRWVDFMMRVELDLRPPDAARAPRSALTIAASYVGGGLIPLLPYMVLHSVPAAFELSVGLTLVALFIFGAVKARFTEINPLRGGTQMALIGGLAASAAFTIARLIGSS